MAGYTKDEGTGRMKCCAGTPILPSGYDYNNMQQVNISGTNWTTYVAYSTTENGEDYKEMVGIYYDQYGTYKNFMYNVWVKTPACQGSCWKYTHRYIFPESYPNYKNYATLIDDGNETVIQGRIRPPSHCGQRVSDCITGFYGGNGWYSVGLTFVTLYQPEVGVGVIGGCMLACALGY